MHKAMIVVLALILDRMLGEPRRAHPLVAFGNLAEHVENRLRAADNVQNRTRGVIAVAILLIPLTAGAAALAALPDIGPVASVMLLYLALGARSLQQHAVRVRTALVAADLKTARSAVACLVSRDTGNMTAIDVARAAVESVLENGNDAIFGALFWFVVAGAPGAVAYRVANTLDAMWGYRTQRYERFGWAAARLDDLFNFLPARLTALTYAFTGQLGSAVACWRRQGWRWAGSNAGTVMAAGGGALRVRLGGGALYHGRWRRRPALGLGAAPRPRDVDRALALVGRGIVLWVGIIGIAGLARAYA